MRYRGKPNKRRVTFSRFAHRGPGWYVEVRRLATLSVWDGPYPTVADAMRYAATLAVA